MRDYNAIPFRSPSKRNTSSRPAPPSHTEEKKETTSRASNTTGSSVSSYALSNPLELGSTASPQQTESIGGPVRKGTRSPSPTLTAADALAVRREGAETTIARLRTALAESNTRDASAKASLAKSDAIILELRSSVRQLKRQLDRVQDEKDSLMEEHKRHMEDFDQESRSIHSQREMMEKFAAENAHLTDARIGELQVQLDRAHAQILTADMVRKELEDTLEAEQYTWELRVQDQERTIQQLQDECAALADDLVQCRNQWKEAEEGWTRDIEELQTKLEKAQQEARHWKSMQQDTQDVGDLKVRILELEQGKGELQGCLDEALKELEAVDAELQGDNGWQAMKNENERLQQRVQDGEAEIVESLKHLYRWLLERNGDEEPVHSAPRDARELIAAIRSYIERAPTGDKDAIETQKRVTELESQLSVYRGDLQAREESSAELRASLKEAVALLKPLQDAVAKADAEKAELQEKIVSLQAGGKVDVGVSVHEMKRLKAELLEKDDEIDRLKQEVQSLEIQLSKSKVMAASNLVAAQRVNDDTETKSPLIRAREELRAKRASENTLKKLLTDAQARFSSLHSQNQQYEARNTELQGRLKEVEGQLGTNLPSDRNHPNEPTEGIESLKKEIELRQTRIHDLENEIKVLKGDLAERTVELRATDQALQESRSVARGMNGNDENYLRSKAKVHELEAKVEAITEQLKAKKASEKKLNRSLKEALGLLKPLQMHLEDAENEKRQLTEEVMALRHRIGEEVSRSSGSFPMPQETAKIRGLEDTVRALEKENAQLHDALDEMSQSVNNSRVSGFTASSRNDSRLREEFVELKSRNEVTQTRLEDAQTENHVLVEALKKREEEEKAFIGEIHALREKLQKAEAELDNAKFIATSALVKVDELTMESVSMSSKGFDQDAVYKQKAKEVDRQVEKSRKGATYKARYRLT